jgi:plastocyanin
MKTSTLCFLCVSALSSGLVFGQETIEVVASKAGFKPKLLNLHKGEPVKLLLTTADGEHCFAIDALRIEKRIRPGRPTTLELTPERAGTFPFYCCLEHDVEAQRGRIVVSE